MDTTTPRKRGRRPTLKEPWDTCAIVLLDRQVAQLDRIAERRGRSRSEVAREAVELFLRVNMEIVPSDATLQEVPA